MRLIFIDDGPIYKDDKGNYYEYAFHGLYERYSYIADQISFVTRVQELSSNTNGTLVPKAVRIVSIPNYKKPRNYFDKKKEAEMILEEEIQNTDVVILRGSSAANLALKYVNKYGKPFIYECVACDWDRYWNYNLIGKIIAPFMEYKTKKIVKNSAFVYYVTQQFLQKRYPTKGISIGCSNVVIAENDKNILIRRIQDHKNSLTKDDKVIIGTAAAIDVKYKGQDDVIKALSILNREGYNVEYRIAGSNRSGSRYLFDIAKKMGVQDKIIYVGSLPQSEMNTYYDSLDIYIQPSKQEGLPRSLIEAMSRGVPCVASNIAGNPELLKEKYLFPKGDVKEIVRVIKRILTFDLREIAKENFKKANQEYNVVVLEKRRQDFYDKFIKYIKNRNT